MSNKDSTQTLCWDCQNAVPNKEGTRGCSWSRNLVPVDGIITNEKGKITYCPEFIPDKPRKKGN